MSTPIHPSFLSRVAIAIGSFFAILANARLAGDIHAVQAHTALGCGAAHATPASSPTATGTPRSEPYSLHEPS